MCKWGNKKKIKVKIPADLSHTGKERYDYKQIDSCIADIVEALQKHGIDMRASCCGHGKRDGEIILADRRTLIIRGRKNMVFSL